MMVPGYVSGVPFLPLFGIGCGVCCLVNQNRRDINKNTAGEPSQKREGAPVVFI